MIASKVIFWMCLGVLTYTYAGYPLLVLLLGCLRRHPKRTDVGEPSVALIIVARNEAGSIERRIRNGLALDYPKDRLRIIVCSDGSTDGTDDIVAECADNRVLLLRVEPQRGQSYCQAQAIGHTEADVIVFSDANTRFDRGSLRHLVEPFGAKGVGCVVGSLRYVSPNDATSVEGESVYWKYEEHIKAAESLLGSCVSGTGAIYAVRRDGYRAIPDGLPGDFVIPLLLALRGQRVLYQPKAVAREELGNSVSGEARRHIRITSRGAYALLWYPPLRRILNPFRSPRLAWQVWSHKVIRWFTMAFIVAGSVSSATLACAGTLYTTAFAVTIGFSLLGLWGAAAKRTHLPRLFGLPHVAFFFLAVSAGMLVGFLRACFRAPVITWEPKR